MSLLRKVCYPQSFRFTSVATSYGCQHEKDAREEYKSRMLRLHAGFVVTPCGFFVDREASYIGASPDALVECTCCGLGVVEIKCPWCAKDVESLVDTVEQRGKKFCLQKTQSGSLELSRGHPYYMQCQLQMHVTRRLYCDFVVWHAAGLHTERLTPDSLLMTEALAKAERFFTLCILPELVGKWFTRSRTNIGQIDVENDEDDEGRWCYCKESKGGDMVACDNAKCLIKWYHMSCLEITVSPKGKWMCPTCHPATKKVTRSKSKKKSKE